MKKTKLLTSLAAFVLVLGLGACNQPDEETTSEESGEVTTTDTGSSDGGTTSQELDGYAIVGDFTDASWDAKPAEDSKYYIPAETTHYEVTIEVPTKDDLGWEPAFRVVEWGDSWNLVAGYESLDTTNSTGVTGANGTEGNIGLEGGTYDLVFDFGETNTILVTLQTEEGGNEGEGDTIPGTNYAIGETYWYGYEYNETLYSFTGEIKSSYYGDVATDTNKSVSVTLGEAEGGYTLSFDDAGTTKYISVSANGDNRNFGISEEQFVWEYNATYDTFVVFDDAKNAYYFIGNYYGTSGTQYDELRASDIGYLDGTLSSSNTQYPAHLYTQDTPTALTITGGRESLYVGNTVKLGIEVANGANHDVTWSSSDATSISVDAYGTIEALALADSVTITATSVKDENVTASINIAVIEATQEEVKLCSYDFSKKTDTTNSVRSTDQMITIFSESFVAGEVTSNIVTSVTTADTIYAQAGGNSGQGNSNLQLSTACIKFGKSSTKGELAFTVSNTITKIELQAAGWSGTQPLTINGVQQSITQSAGSVSAVDDLTTYTYEIAEATSIDMVTSERVLLFNMTFYGYL